MKKYIIFTGIFVMGGLLAGCGATQGKDLGKDSAKNIAFEEAGVTEDQVARLRVSKDRDDGRVVYEIDFDAGETEYNYDIAAKNGEILSAETEKRDSFANVQPNAMVLQNSRKNPEVRNSKIQQTARQIQHCPRQRKIHSLRLLYREILRISQQPSARRKHRRQPWQEFPEQS